MFKGTQYRVDGNTGLSETHPMPQHTSSQAATSLSPLSPQLNLTSLSMQLGSEAHTARESVHINTQSLLDLLPLFHRR